MKLFVAALGAFLLLGSNAFAADDAANQAKFEKDCAAMIAAGGPCADAAKGGGGRRACVAKPENLAKASPACKAVIAEWKAMKK